MKFSLVPLLLLALPSLAHAASPADAPIPIPGDAQAPVAAPQSTSPADGAEDLEIKPVGIIEGIKKYAKVTIMGGTMVDTDRREKEDARDGVTRVTDANWDELMEETGEDDLWLIFLHGQNTGLKDPHLETHLNASKLATEVSALDPAAATLKKTHYVRLDYMTEPYICNKWLVFRPPWYIFATNKGKDLRFLRCNGFPQNGTFMHEVVKAGTWKDIPVWKGSFAPGGSRAWIPEMYVEFQKKVAGVPNIAWIGLTGLISQAILRYFQVN